MEASAKYWNVYIKLSHCVRLIGNHKFILDLCGTPPPPSQQCKNLTVDLEKIREMFISFLVSTIERSMCGIQCHLAVRIRTT